LDHPVQTTDLVARGTRIHSELGWSSADQILVRGRSLPDEILGHMSLGTFAFFELTGREPDADEAALFDAVVITLVEHGLTPSALAARLTYLGAPESMQGAVAAGLAGLGTVFAGTIEGAAQMLTEALETRPGGTTLEEVARFTVVARSGQVIPGLGHPIHKPVDPRTVRLFELARQHRRAGDYVQLMELIGAEAERVTGRVLPVNATGAIGAICCELGFPWRMTRGIAVIARAIGLVAHVGEELENPIAGELWRRAEEESGG
jgi:citrate synthase